jgi:2'-5' RNA ligase
MADRKLFYALWPDDRQRDMMRNITNPAISPVEGTAVDRRNWHLTLVYIGAFAEENIPALQAAVSEIEPFEFDCALTASASGNVQKLPACIPAICQPSSGNW